MLTDFFSPLPPFTSALSFNFTNFTPGDKNISYDRAFAEKQVLQLTGSEIRTGDVGRATYFKSMHLWDKESRNLTDFTTSFSFVINSRNNANYGDGLAFFLAPTDSTIPEDSTGAGLGLATNNQSLNTTANHFVAVEFDIFFHPSTNAWDPPGVHVGIDINSLNSSAYVFWKRANTSITQGLPNEAQISYDSTSHNLSVLLTGFINDSTVEQSLSYIVDLRDCLPEWVTFGFSAASGGSAAMHTIHTWNFSSEDIVTNPTVVAGRPSPSPNPSPNPRKNNGLGLAVGLGVGGSFLFGGLALILFCFWKRNRSHTEDDLALDSCMDEEFQRGTGPKRFSFKELAHATNDFNDEEKLGQGGFGGAPEDQVVMVQWVWKLYGVGKVLEAADPRLGGDFDEQQMERLMIVGLWCAHPDRDLRPSIKQAIDVLNFETPIPVLPSNMPGPPHLAPKVSRHAMSLSISSGSIDYDGGQN
ncbi:hypothetical protein FH972_004841 [Carpinus fangiana]|uniref:Legume lectin domain-containing protein n=1 Tax=Carpinus fangiana TaxID=176857 RepID=A0A5N6QQR9_9ROSI|nr:hypothetical protein FH972_004841 [Carpinus fangiana]